MWYWESKRKNKCKKRDCSILIKNMRNSGRLLWKMSKKERLCGRHRNWNIWSRIWRERYRRGRNILKLVLICLMWFLMLQSCATHIRNITVKQEKRKGRGFGGIKSFGIDFDICYCFLLLRFFSGSRGILERFDG